MHIFFKKNHRTINTITAASIIALGLSACGGGGGGGGEVLDGQYIITVNTGTGGSASAESLSVAPDESVQITITPDDGYVLESISGCNGSYIPGFYGIETVTENCTVTANFTPWVLDLELDSMKTFRFSWPNVMGATHYRLTENPDGVQGYSDVNANIASLGYDHIVPLHKRFNASYIIEACYNDDCPHTSAATHVTGSLAEAVGYIKAGNFSSSSNFGWSVALSADGSTMAIGARYQGEALGDTSGAVYVYKQQGNQWVEQAFIDSPVTDVLYYNFGHDIALSADGNTLVIGSPKDHSGTTGVDAEQTYTGSNRSGAAYVYTRSGDNWTLDTYIKAEENKDSAEFGSSVAISGDGQVLVVAAPLIDDTVYIYENTGSGWVYRQSVKKWTVSSLDTFGRSLAISHNGSVIAVGDDYDSNGGMLDDNYAPTSGAVYVFRRNGDSWDNDVRLQASNYENGDEFGSSVAISGDGNTIAVGAHREASNAIGINPGTAAEANNDAPSSGAAYVFNYAEGLWSQQAYIKASNAEAGDRFGRALSLSQDGKDLVVQAPRERGASLGINGDQNDNSADNRGAAYLFRLNGDGWQQSAYIKDSSGTSNHSTEPSTRSIAISADGDTLVVGAHAENVSGHGAIFLY